MQHHARFAQTALDCCCCPPEPDMSEMHVTCLQALVLSPGCAMAVLLSGDSNVVDVIIRIRHLFFRMGHVFIVLIVQNGKNQAICIQQLHNVKGC